MMRWNRGDVVVCRYVGLGRTFFAAPLIVDHDDVDWTGVYKLPGMPSRQVAPVDGSALPRVVPPGYFERTATSLQRQERGDNPSLVIMRDGRHHAIHVHWDAGTWAPSGFYVNLQTPAIRDACGLSTVDQFLDIRVDAGLEWEWKDEDELDEAVRVGRLTGSEANAVRAEGLLVVSDIDDRRWPFDGSFDDWRPDPAWTVPAFPAEREGLYQ